MPPLRPFRTLNYPITRTSNSNASFRTPILASIALYRLPPQSQSSLVQPNKSTFSTSTIRPTSNQDDQYDPPGGWFLGIPPGEKYVNEGWEPAWIWGFWGSLIVGAIAYAFKPDTSIQTWALEEARRRLEAEGILPDPYPSGVPADDTTKSD